MFGYSELNLHNLSKSHQIGCLIMFSKPKIEIKEKKKCY